MSRIGNKIINIPDDVEINQTHSEINVKGPKGALKMDSFSNIELVISDNSLTVKRANDTKSLKAKHGLVRSLINNMVVGVTKGYELKIELQGIGFRVKKQGKGISLMLGYSHDVTFEPPEGIDLQVEGQTIILITGIDKQLVGQACANLRKLRKPDSYKGKGVRLFGEKIVLKPGKSVKK